MEFSREPNVGKQTTYFEPPDIIFLKLRGHVTFEEGNEINRLHLEWALGLPNVFFLIDLAELQRIDADVRKLATESLARLPLRGMVGFSAPLKAKVIATLIFTAINLFAKKADKIPLKFVATEEEARAWIEQWRRELPQQAKPALGGAAHGR
jgi:hypothetical protein